MNVLLTGMPRSGTSLLAAVVHRMGFDFGPEDALATADEWNPDGYFERVDVVVMNQGLIDRLGGQNVVPPVRSVYELEDLEAQVERAESLKAQVPTLKIPRAAFLRPVWDSPDALWIVSVRHPLEVAASWERAYGKVTQETLGYWVDYNRSYAELPVGRTLIVSYDEWFTDHRRQLKRLARFLNTSSNRTVLDLVKPHYRHTEFQGASGHDEADALYQGLLRCA